MQCIFCMRIDPDGGFTVEHIFPESIGGTMTMRRVCKPCNDRLGERTDAPLANHAFIGLVRMRLGLAGKGGNIPNPLARGTLHNDPTRKIALTRQENSTYTIYMHPKIVSTGTGIDRQIEFHIDASDADRLGDIVNKKLAREGLPRFSDHEIEALKSQITEINNPSVKVPLSIDLSEYRYGLVKIAYELAHYWIGEPYLGDPTAAVLRNCALNTPADFAPGVRGSFSHTAEQPLLTLWADEPDSLIGAALRTDGRIAVFVRILGVFDAMVCVTEHASKYPAFEERFVLIDPIGKNSRSSTWLDEARRVSDLERRR